MSSRSDAKKLMKFCKHMRETIIDEQKAAPDYFLLYKEATHLPMLDESVLTELWGTIVENAGDEKKHKKNLMPLFNKICPRMAVHRKGIR